MLRPFFCFVVMAWVLHGMVAAQSSPVYRCGNAYTNQPDASRDCKPLSGGNVTVIEGTRVQGAAPSGSVAGANTASPAGSSAAVKVDPAEQRQRDAQAQRVLQTELQRVQKQQAELLREWNNGEPERRADEFRQPQKYQDRVTQLRSTLQRTEADVAGLQRELSRLISASSSGVKP